MQHWLLKSEPSCYSWQDMITDKITRWDGVRNFQARNYMRAMQLSDLCLFYESSPSKSIAGVVRVIKTYYPDPDAEEFGMVDVEHVMNFSSTLKLHDIRLSEQLAGILLLKQPRLSVMPLSEAHWDYILKSVGHEIEIKELHKSHSVR